MSQSTTRERLTRCLSSIERQDHYGAIGASRDATAPQLRVAYREAVSRLDDPQLTHTSHEDLLLLVPRIRTGLDRALSVLTNPVRRAAYDARRKPATPAEILASKQAALPSAKEIEELLTVPAATLGRRVPEVAALLHQLGCRAFAKEDYGFAERLLRRSLDLEPDNAVYALKLGWTVFKNPAREAGDRADTAKPYMDHAVAASPYDANARFMMAEYWREVGNRLQRKRELEAVLRCDPTHRRARHELERISHEEGREQSTAATSERRRMFGRWFRKNA